MRHIEIPCFGSVYTTLLLIDSDCELSSFLVFCFFSFFVSVCSREYQLRPSLDYCLDCRSRLPHVVGGEDRTLGPTVPCTIPYLCIIHAASEHEHSTLKAPMIYARIDRFHRSIPKYITLTCTRYVSIA